MTHRGNSECRLTFERPERFGNLRILEQLGEVEQGPDDGVPDVLDLGA